MITKSFFNTSQEEIDDKRWNPYLGISINNKAFTCGYLVAYMQWATERAKDSAAILIVDIIQHINNQIFDKSKPISASDKAFRKADEIHRLCDQAKQHLDDDQLAKLVILEWTDIVYDAHFRHNLAVIRDEYAQNEQFKQALLSITRRNLGSIINRLNADQIEMLTQYIVNELPELITGFNYQGVHYNLNVYPGKIASIYAELLELEFFPQIQSKLQIIGEIASVEAYLEGEG